MLYNIELHQCQAQRAEQTSEEHPVVTLSDFLGPLFASSYLYNFCASAFEQSQTLPCLLNCRQFIPEAICFGNLMLLKSSGPIPDPKASSAEDIMGCINEQNRIVADLESCRQDIGETENSGH